MKLWDKAERLWTRVKNWKTVRGWHIWKLKLVDARLYFVSMFVGLLTGLVAVPYHYLLYYLFHLRSGFFASHPAWYWHIPLFLFSWGILVFVMWLVGKMPLIGGGILSSRWYPSLQGAFCPSRRGCLWGAKGLPCR